MGFIWVLFAVTVKVIADGDIVVGSVHQVALLHENVTVQCQVMTNRSGQLNSTNAVFTWTFSPFNSSKTYSILRNSDNSSTSLQSSTGIKYYRPSWRDLVIISVDENDAGTYTCTTSSNVSDSADIYVLESSPECVKDNEGPVYVEGQTVSLNCSVGYYGTPIQP